MSHVTYRYNEKSRRIWHDCHIYEDTSHTWMSHIAHWYSEKSRRTWHDCHMYEVTSHVCIICESSQKSRRTCNDYKVMSHICMNHVTHRWSEKSRCAVPSMYMKSHHPCESVTSHMWMSHAISMSESCHTHKWAMSYTSRTHFRHWLTFVPSHKHHKLLLTNITNLSQSQKESVHCWTLGITTARPNQSCMFPYR